MKHFFWIAPTSVLVATAPCFAAQYLTVNQAQVLCFPKATRFVSTPITLTDAQMAAIQSQSGVDVKSNKQAVWKAYADATFLGWFISDSVIGKHDFIDWSLALNPDGSVHQVEILQYKERYGSEIRKPEWRGQFVGKTAADPLKLDGDIRNITGATLSSRHLTEGVKRLLSFYDVVLKAH